MKRVKAITTGAERTRISACFTATAAGEKLPIYILIPRKTDIPNYIPPNNVIIDYKIGATFDEAVVEKYILKVLAPDKLMKGLDSTRLFSILLHAIRPLK